jgi:superfamily II DNA/RNA helicase
VIEDVAFSKANSIEGAWALLRQIAGHPASILHSAKTSKLAAEVAGVLGEDHLRSIPSAKTIELLAYLEPIIADQEAKAIVFTFFGQSVLREVWRFLTGAGLEVFTYHGGKTGAENDRALEDFKKFSGGAILLSSDSGARGINVPEATYVVEYESATTHGMRVQRRERAHRLNSALGPVTGLTMIAEGTIEENIMASVLRRNTTADIFTGDVTAGGDFISAADRKEIIDSARERYHRSKLR